jgi:hypothetical protein
VILILDVRTIGIVSAFTPLILGFILLIYWKERKVYGGFGRWVMANFGLSSGYLFMSMPGLLPPFLSLFLGNCLIVYCMILIYEGIEQFYDRPPLHALNYLILGVYIVLQFFFIYIRPNANARLAYSSAAMFLLIVLAGRRLFVVPIPGLVRTSRAAGYVFFMTALFPFILVLTSIEMAPPMDFISDVLNSWF